MYRASVQFFIFSTMILSSGFTEASTAPQCSAVLMFQKSEIESKVTAIVQTIATYQMKAAQGLQRDQTALSEAIRQIDEITKKFPDMIEFYHAEMKRVLSNDSPIKKEVKRVAAKEEVLNQKIEMSDSVIVIGKYGNKDYILKKKDGTYFTITNNPSLSDFINGQKNIQQIVSNKEHNAIAVLKKDGTVETWGDQEDGGNSSHLNLKNVQEIFATERAFAALKRDGTVEAWGSINTSGVDLTNVKSIVSSERVFALLKNNGSVVAFGIGLGNENTTPSDLYDVKSLYSTNQAFAALKNDGTVVTWGNKYKGGESSNLDLTNVLSVFSTDSAFAVLKKDGTVATWGSTIEGGYSSKIDLTNVHFIYSTRYAFAALKYDGTVVTWGHDKYGATSSHLNLKDIKNIFSTHSSFAAIDKNGSVFTWGDSAEGGNSTYVQNQLYKIKHIIEVKSGSFIAHREDGKYILWGEAIGDFKNQVIDFDLY